MLGAVRNRRAFESVGTLGDDTGLTCSMDAVRRWGKAKLIVPFRTFEAAAGAAKLREISGLVVPAAYPRLSYLIMDSGLEAVETFLLRIPALVAASCKAIAPRTAIVYHHPATAPLLSEVDTEFEAIAEVGSNIEACKSALANPDSVAITNAHCAQHYQLPVRKILREGIRMPWIVFVPAASSGVPERRRAASVA